MKINNQINFIEITKSANSLYSLIADGQYRSTSLGRDKWKSLIGSEASLQINCNKEGFNAVSAKRRRSKARIGILGNNEDDCRVCDCRIGFGTRGKHDNNACGNEAAHGGDNGNKHIKVMGYILVQWQENTTEEICWSFSCITITFYNYIQKADNKDKHIKAMGYILVQWQENTTVENLLKFFLYHDHIPCVYTAGNLTVHLYELQFA